ncbi:type I polyketide synthase [Polyangium aurulentum]|uniref:type I polyketide synthase n=1 Tax=Polyangium aurulentum TaxID=2567896 RepID=UPI00200E7814|nr:type I polyketide synthase [Polyangium aurulentum]UQA57022.1 acyltransferase domain-containing protein [Polyangium aurulentum]
MLDYPLDPPQELIQCPGNISGEYACLEGLGVFNPPGTMGQPGSAPVDVRSLLRQTLASRLGISAGGIDPGERFSRYGLGSLDAAALLKELEIALGRPLSPTLFWEHPTVETLAAHLLGEPAADAVRPHDALEVERKPFSSRAAPRAAEPMAIVGLACRFPGAPSAEAFWKLLASGGDAITETPTDRYHDSAGDDRGTEEEAGLRWGGFLEQVDHFDPQFFGISPREATHMDPQQRLVLEVCWEALEDAGIAASALQDEPVGVFMGAWQCDYANIAGATEIAQHTSTGQNTSIIAARVSYVLGLQGPSLTVNTACSSSLVAVHLACQSLAAGECTMAIAGGVNLLLDPASTQMMLKFGGLSPAGRCKAFDDRADGYVRGEGAGMVVLKPLSLALADGDPIYCVIRGSAVNNDGFSNGLTAPNPRAQEALLRAVYARAGVEPRRVHFVEAHGTGTRLGDPIEAKALGAVLGAGRAQDKPLRVGSVKTNIGHLEAASGIAGLIKVALAMRHELVPGNLHFEQPNRHISFEQLGLRVQAALEPWPCGGEPPLAGISSFGFGGTNCHVVVEGADARSAHLVPLAAQSPQGLRRLARELEARLAGGPSLPALCSATAAQWTRGQHRLALTAHSHEQLAEQLRRFLDGHVGPGIAAGIVPEGRRSRVAFVFSGQGSQWPGMGRGLLRQEAFRAALERCSAVIREQTGWSVLEELLAPPAESRLHEIEVMWPAIFAFQVALAELWSSWGIRPDAVVGQSIGEVAAACVIGALSLEDAARVICHEARLVGRTGGRGAMALVGLPWEGAREVIAAYDGRVSLAIQSSPTSTVLSGEAQALHQVAAALDQQGVFCRLIQTNAAVHGPAMSEVGPALREALSEMRPRRAMVTIVSSRTALPVEGTDLDPSYWALGLQEPVLFQPAIEHLAEQGYDVFLEISPHAIVARSVAETLEAARHRGVSLSSLRRGEDERTSLLDGLGVIYTLGLPVQWDRLPGAVTLEAAGLLALEGDEAQDGGPIEGAARADLLPLSARSDEALRDLARSTLPLLAEQPGPTLRDICFTAGARRQHHAHRLAVMARSRKEAAEGLQAFLEGGQRPGVSISSGEEDAHSPGKIIFVYSGQGSQWLGMGRDLLEQEPVFREALEACDERLRKLAGWSLLDELRSDAQRQRLDQTEVAQPVIFAIQVALSALWRSFGITPGAVVGHSVGEIAAAHEAGILDLADAIRVVLQRSRLMQRATGRGQMAAVELSSEDAERALSGYEGRLSIAAINGPRATVLSGDAGALEEVLAALRARKVACRSLGVNYAFHSPQMDPYRDELVASLRGIVRRPARLGIASTVTGDLAGEDDFNAAYWGRNIREPVRFLAAIDALIEKGDETFLEIGPHPVLTRGLTDLLEARGGRGAVLPSLRRERDGRSSLLASLGALYAQGRQVSWRALHREGGQVVSLPHYPWQRQRYWIEGSGPRQKARPDARPSASDALADRLYEIRWEPGTERPVAAEMTDGQPGRWLILADRGGVGARLTELLRARGHVASLLRRPGGVEAACAHPDGGLEPLLDEVMAERGEPFRGVVDLWSLDDATATQEGTDAAALVEAHTASCAAAATVLRALARARSAEHPRLWLVTRGATAPEPASVLQAPLWGLGRVIGLEHPTLWGGLVDLGPTPSREEDARALLRELLQRDDEDHVALRGNKRRVPRLVPVEAKAGVDARPRLHADAAYLITGGLGHLGVRLSQWLVEHGARNLILMGRRGLGASGPDDIDADRRLRAVRALEARGARVRVLEVDVGDETRMRAALDVMRVDGPPLRGIVHAAGVMTPQPLLLASSATLRAELRAKVAGAWALHRWTQGVALDFFVLCSSAAGVWGSGQLAGYAAANHFLDALAHLRRAQGMPALSVDWGPWAGDGIASKQVQAAWERMGIAPLPEDEALTALGYLLASGAVQATVARVDWRAFKPIYEARGRRPLLARIAQGEANAEGASTAPPRLARRLQEARPHDRRDLLTALVQEEIRNVLGITSAQPLDPRKGFAQMGMDSMMAVELVRSLEGGVGHRLPSSLPFDYPTLEALVEHLGRELLPRDASEPEPVAHARHAAEAQANDGASASAPEMDSDVDALSEEDALGLLVQELDRIDARRSR